MEYIFEGIRRRLERARKFYDRRFLLINLGIFKAGVNRYLLIRALSFDKTVVYNQGIGQKWVYLM